MLVIQHVDLKSKYKMSYNTWLIGLFWRWNGMTHLNYPGTYLLLVLGPSSVPYILDDPITVELDLLAV